MLRFDADTGVADGKRRMAITHFPAYFDFPVFRRIAHGVADQVAKCAAQFFGIAFEPFGAFQRYANPMAASG